MKDVRIGQRIDAYHDGKASPSRLKVVVVDDVIDRNDLSKRAQRLWRKALRADFKGVFEGIVCYYSGGRSTKQFWDWNCSEFIEGHFLDEGDNKKSYMLFAKRPHDWGWYGVDYNYSLDVSGRVRRRHIGTWKKCAAENGLSMKWNHNLGRYDYFALKTGEQVDSGLL